jgi:L-lactate dehydrogenase complex protein LldF
VLIHLRSKLVREKQGHVSGKLSRENLGMKAMVRVFQSEWLLRKAHRLARLGQGPFLDDNVVSSMPGLSAWTRGRDLPAIPKQSFREWWREREKQKEAANERK